MLGYLGEPARLGALVDDPPHSLEKQSYAAKHMDGAVVNADGWGFGWYVAGDAAACVYRATQPIWGDVNKGHLGRAIRSDCILAAVRSATDPLSLSHANTQPFANGPLLFLHNGYIRDFSSKVMRRLRLSLSDEQYASLQGNTDSEHLFAVFVDEYARLASQPADERLLGAVRSTLRRTTTLAVEAETKALLSVLVSDGNCIVAARSATGADPPSLYVLQGPSPLAAGTLVASEPLDDDDGWYALTPGRAVVVTRQEAPREVTLR